MPLKQGFNFNLDRRIMYYPSPKNILGAIFIDKKIMPIRHSFLVRGI